MDASKLIDEKLASLTDWRGDLMRAFRKLIHEVDPDIVEEWKWMGSPTWNHAGIICVANAHKATVKVTFLYGAKLSDPAGIFNSELEGNARRAIKWEEGDKINVAALKGILREAMAINDAKPAARQPDAKSSVSGMKPASTSNAPAKRAAPKKAAVKKAAAPKKAAPKKAVSARAKPKR